MICVEADVNGVIRVITPQPIDVSTCTAVLIDGAQLANNPFALTIEQGAQIGGAVVLVWAMAWAFKTIARFISSEEKEQEP